MDVQSQNGKGDQQTTQVVSGTKEESAVKRKFIETTILGYGVLAILWEMAKATVGFFTFQLLKKWWESKKHTTEKRAEQPACPGAEKPKDES